MSQEPTTQPKKKRGRKPKQSPHSDTHPAEETQNPPPATRNPQPETTPPAPSISPSLTSCSLLPTSFTPWDPLEEIIWTVGTYRPDEAETLPESTIGREAALTAIRRFLARGRHVLIVGPRGTGKSHLLRHTARELLPGEDTPYLWLDDFKAQKGILKDICLELHEAGHLSRYQEEPDPDRVNAILSRLRVSKLIEKRARFVTTPDGIQ